MDASRLNIDQLPTVFESCEVSGCVSEEGARRAGLWGLTPLASVASTISPQVAANGRSAQFVQDALETT